MRANVKLDLNLAKTMKDFDRCFKRGRRMMKSEIVKDTQPFTPMDKGTLVESVIPSSHKDDDELVWRVPYASFINRGKLFIYEPTGSSWAPQGKSKVMTSKDLKYHSSDSDRRDHFYDRAKERNQKKWEKVFQKGAERK